VLRHNGLAGTLARTTARVAPCEAAGGEVVAERMDEGLFLAHCGDVWVGI